MPNQPKTPARSVRVGAPLWEAAQTKAADRGETVTDVIVRALEHYVGSETVSDCPACRHNADRHGPEAGGCIECRCANLLADFAESLEQMRRGEGIVLHEKPPQS